MHSFHLHLNAGTLTLPQLRRIAAEPVRLTLEDGSWRALQAAQAVVERKVAAGKVTYGVNTGFGRLAQTRIPDDQLGELQSRLIQSHAAGVGTPLDTATVRLILVLKINSLARGYSGVRAVVVRHLLALLEHGYMPVIPGQGSVGASGDLAPLAHLSLPLLGLGEVQKDGQRIPGAEALQRLGLEPIELHAKEGLALLNGTQVSTALALQGLFDAERNAAAALAAGALSVEATLGSRVPFDARIHEARGQQCHGFHRKNVRRHPAEFVRNGRVLADGRAPLDAFRGPRPRNFQATLCQPNARGRQGQPPGVQRGQRDAQPFALGQQDVFRRHANVLKADDAVV